MAADEGGLLRKVKARQRCHLLVAAVGWLGYCDFLAAKST
jgi:hypothetical protein